MVGVGARVTGAAPLAGGVLLGGMAGKSGPSVPDLRAVIISGTGLAEADSGRRRGPSSGVGASDRKARRGPPRGSREKSGV